MMNKLKYIELTMAPHTEHTLTWTPLEPVSVFEFRCRGNYYGIDVKSIVFNCEEQLAVANCPLELITQIAGPKLMLPIVYPGSRIDVVLMNSTDAVKAFRMRPIAYTDVDDDPDTIPAPAPTEPNNEPPECELCKETIGHDPACPRSGAIAP